MATQPAPGSKPPSAARTASLATVAPGARPDPAAGSVPPRQPVSNRPAAPTGANSGLLEKVRVWDLPTRLFHLLLVLALIFLVASGLRGGKWIKWHMLTGLFVLALVTFRIIWGFVGGRWSRFTSFVRGWDAVSRYLKNKARPGDNFEVGHNPVGGWAVLLILGLLLLQALSGLVTDDQVVNYGPFARRVEYDFSVLATKWHTGPGKLLILLVAVVHVGAIVYQRIRRKNNLVLPMITGDKALPLGTPRSSDTLVNRLIALVLIVALAAAAAWLRTFR